MSAGDIDLAWYGLPSTAGEALANMDMFADAQLERYGTRLVREAQRGEYSLQTRARFLLAVGAVAMLTRVYTKNKPRAARQVANRVMRRIDYDGIITRYDNMPSWKIPDWNKAVEGAFAATCFTEEHEWRTYPEFSGAGCLEMLAHLDYKRAVVLDEAMAGR